MAGRVATYAPDMTDSGAESELTTHIEPARRTTDWREVLLGRDSFFPVLLLAIATILVSPLLDTFRLGFLILFPASALMVLLAFYRSQVRRRTLTSVFVMLIVIGTLTMITSIVRIIDVTDDRYLIAFSSAMFAILIAFAFPVVVRRAFQHERVSLNTLAAGLTAYLLIGVFFSTLYRCDSALQNFTIFAETTQPNGDYTYFSFVTLTTLGYGDLTPATDVARSLAIFEAILGQVFLVTAVARIVSLMGSERTTSVGLPAGHDFTTPAAGSGADAD